MKIYFSILIYCGLFFIFQASGKVNMIGSTKVKRAWNKHGWVLSAATPCSSTCGEGIQTSFYECKHVGNRNFVPSFYCLHTAKPEPIVKACTSVPCQPVWLVSDWNSCNVTCGFGVKTRSVRCGLKGQDGKPSFVQDEFCPQLKPAVRRMCNDGRCPHWRSEKWTKCSVTCGQGFSWRKVKCIGDDEALCPMTKKPKSKKICYEGPCLEIEIKMDEDLEKDDNIPDPIDAQNENQVTGNEKSLEEDDKEVVENDHDDDVNKDDFSGELKIELYDLDDDKETNLNMGDYIKLDGNEDVYPDYGTEFRKKFNGDGSEPSEPTKQKSHQKTGVLPGNKTSTKNANFNLPTHSQSWSTKLQKDVAIRNYRYMQYLQCDDCSISLVIADDETIVYLLNNSTVNLICSNEEHETLIWYRNEAVVSKSQRYQLRRVTPLDSGIYLCFRNAKVSKVAVLVIDQVYGMQHLQRNSVESILNPEEPIDIVPNSNFNQQFTIHLGVAYAPPYRLTNFFVEQQITCYISTNLFFMHLDMSICDEDRASIVPYISSEMPIYKWEHSDWSDCSEECTGNGVGKRTRVVWCHSPGGHKVDDQHCLSTGQEKEVSRTHCPKEVCIPHWKAHKFSDCKGICGRYGSMSRKVECTWALGAVVEDRMCEAREKPMEMMECRVYCDVSKPEACIDKEECKMIDPVEKCEDWNLKYCCETCSS